jgi:hypothetical protein
MSSNYAYEKLGLLYLGREVDISSGTTTTTPLLYKNKNMTTHGVIIGMTGSGKTGLGIGLIEEAIMDDVPSIIIDPKGDMGNLLLSFPDCSKEDFAPWVDPAEAARKGMSLDEYAAETAKTWRDGLEAWDQGTERIAAMRAKTDMVIYTPGSSAGVSISVLAGFEAPAEDLLNDTDTLNSLVNATSTSLLSLVDIKGDPLQSKEHILLSSLLLHFWRKGKTVSMEALIGSIVSPPFEKVGVFGLDTFYPQPQRMSLAMNLNNILASPSFSAWTEGEPLDIQRILYGEEGRPRTAIFSIAHLSETERMFFVTMLLNQFIGWMRRQQGSSSLKALLYMDEIFGYFPPTASPPSKKPMMLLLKQARAFGVGVVLATQNPVDLDYKGLSNIGSWFVGRLQTRQDQQRVVEGIVGASGGQLDTTMVRTLLADMKGRQFLLNSAHLDEPVLFESRWVMSYLKGPISKNDIKKLMAGKVDKPTEAGDAFSSNQAPETTEKNGVENLAPIVSAGIKQLYHLQNVVRDDIRLEPWLAAEASVRFYNARRNIDKVEQQRLKFYLEPSSKSVEWKSAEEIDFSLDDCLRQPPEGCSYLPLPGYFSGIKDLSVQKKEFSEFLYQNRRLEMYKATGTSLESLPDETAGDFRVRLMDYLRDQKEEAVEKIRTRYQAKQDRLEQKLSRVLARVDKEKQDVQTKTTDSIISFGAAVVGAFFGRKTFSAGNVSKAATGMRNVGRVAKEKGDVKRAEQAVLEVQQELEDLALEVEEKVAEISEKYAIDDYPLETFAIKPRRSDIFDVKLVLLWEMIS